MSKHRVTIVGGGHNALTAAAYLARAGVDVTVLERLPQVGGAAISAQAFDGVDARLSRYSYLVSLMPQQIVDDLGLSVQLVRRRYSSYTPEPGTDRGLLIDNQDWTATTESFAAIRAADDATAFAEFYRRTEIIARAIFPTVTEPLPTSAQVRSLIGEQNWAQFVESPIAAVIEESFSNDVVRGVVATDALIGTFAALDDPRLDQNRCFLYHVIGGGTGDWDVPIGGMGVVSGELGRVARASGARIVTDATVTKIDGTTVHYLLGEQERTLDANLVLAGVAPAILAELIGGTIDRPEGAQVKANLLLSRLPRLRQDSVDPRAAFGGTFHINETYRQLQAAYAAAAGGGIPDPLPCEIYCHSLADRSILGVDGAQTITVFGLHVPDRLTGQVGNDELRGVLRQRVIDSLNSVLGEPIEPLLLTDQSGTPCIEVKTTRDIEDALTMPGGQIFHGPLSWPWLEDPATDPATRWGVATAYDGILVCGAGAQRGGGVSGIGGHNAAMAALEILP